MYEHVQISVTDITSHQLLYEVVVTELAAIKCLGQGTDIWRKLAASKVPNDCISTLKEIVPGYLVHIAYTYVDSANAHSGLPKKDNK